MTRTILMALAVSAAGLAWAAPGRAQTGNLTATDRQFLREASAGNAAEVEFGQLAGRKAQNVAVREFGRWMQSAHGTAQRELTTMIEHLHAQPPQPALTTEQAATLHRLEGLNGQPFDRLFLATMIHDHETVIPKFQHEANDGDNPALKEWAQTLLPALDEHLAEARDLDRDLFTRTARTTVAPITGANPAAMEQGAGQQGSVGANPAARALPGGQ